MTDIHGNPVPQGSHDCSSQCDDCHTLENCIGATRRIDDLLLCAGCYEARTS